MTAIRIGLILFVGAAIIGCSDAGLTESEYDATTQLNAAKADVQKDVGADSWTAFSDEIYLGCLNEGEGEMALLQGDGRWTTNIVTTPKGAQHYNGFITEWNLSVTGQTTGEVFEGTGRGHVALHFKADGNVVVSEPLLEVLHERGGNRTLRTLTQWMGSTNGGNPDIFAFRITVCQLN